jgi:hypothetical protein
MGGSAAPMPRPSRYALAGSLIVALGCMPPSQGTPVASLDAVVDGEAAVPLDDAPRPPTDVADVFARTDVATDALIAVDVRDAAVTDVRAVTDVASDALTTSDAHDATITDVRAATDALTATDAPVTTVTDAPVTTVTDAPVTTVTDAPDAGGELPGLPPIEVYEGTLPTPSRAPMGWAPLRITRRTVADGVTTTVDRLVFTYSDRRVNSVETQRWTGSAWLPYEFNTWVYGGTGRIEGRVVYRHTGSWTLFQRWNYEFNTDGTLRVEHGEVRNGTAWAETMQRTWEWVGRLPGWQRYYEAPAIGRPSVRHWENAYDYDGAGRLTGYLRYEAPAAPPPLLGNGRRVLTVRPSGHLDRETFIFGATRDDTVYRYNRAGAIVEVAARDVVDRYTYDNEGRLRLVRSYTRFVDAWSLTREVELEHTTDGGDATFSLFVDPVEAWRRDYYGRGDLLDRYRR